MINLRKTSCFHSKSASALAGNPQLRVRVTQPVALMTLIHRILIRGALLFALTLPNYAAFQVQRLQQIPAEPGQQILASKTDSKGNLIVTAYVSVPDVYNPVSFGLIKKIDSAGNELFSRILPGVVSLAMPIAIDGNDDIYVAGTTSTPSEFPFTNTLSGIAEGGFMMKLRGHDGTMVYSTSWAYAIPDSIVVDGAGQALVTTSILAATLPTTPGAYSSPAGRSLTALMYLVRFSAAGDRILLSARYGGATSICYTGSSCAGATQFTGGGRIILDGQGNIWVAGTTNTTDLPVTPDALKKTCGCSPYAGDGFLAKFTADGSRLLYATYFGTAPANAFDFAGSGNDYTSAAATDSAGHIWFVGYSNGADLPVTANASQKQVAGGTDGFVAEYDPATNQFLYVTYFGGSDDDSIINIQIAPDGTVIMSGHSNSSILPSAATGFTRGTDFVASLDPHTYAITGLTRFPNGAVGTGLASTPTGFIVSGASNVAAFLETGAGNSPGIYAVMNSAGTAVAGQVAPGELISLYGANLAPVLAAVADLSSGQAPTKLGTVRVLVDGTPAPLLYTQGDQINAIMPFGLMNAVTHITVSNGGVQSNEAVLGVQAAAPEAFKTNSKLWAAALNEDGTMNSAANHARLGSVVSVFATGFGYLFPTPKDGEVVTGALSNVSARVEVLYQGQYLDVTNAASAPSTVAGLTQVTFRLPTSTGTSTPAFDFLVDGWPSTGFVILVKE